MPCDLPEYVDWHPGVGHLREPGVPEVVSAKVLKAEGGDHLVPVRGVPQDRGRDPAAAARSRLLVVADYDPALRYLCLTALDTIVG